MTEHPITEQMLAEKNATGHSIFGPSSAHRWFRCPRSLIAGYLAGDRPTKYAAEGSVAHWLAEDWLNNGSPERHLGKVIEKDGFEIEITEEMISYVGEYVGWVSTTSGRHFVEVRVDLSAYTPVPSFGTGDHIFAEPEILTITDLKYGKVRVQAKDNEQLKCYALGAFDELDPLFDFQKIVMRICQPRLENYDEVTITREEMLAFRDELREAAHAAWDPEAPYRADPVACEYCPARFNCPALADVLVKAAKGAFDDLDETVSPSQAVAVVQQEIISVQPQLPAFDSMPLEKLAMIYDWRQTFEKWFREAYEYLIHELELGREVPGRKLAMGRAGNRKWIDEKGVKKLLLQHGITTLDLYDEKFISPPVANMLLRLSRGGTIKENDALLEQFVNRPPGKLTMVSASDPRKGTPSAASAFDDVE